MYSFSRTAPEVILIVLLLSFRRRGSLPVCTVSLWYPLVLYGLLYYQTGLINRVVVPQFLDGFFMHLDVRIFGEFPAFFLRGKQGNAFLDEFFHFFYFSYYLIIPLTGILLFRKDVKLFERLHFPAFLLVLPVFCHLHSPAGRGTDSSAK